WAFWWCRHHGREGRARVRAALAHPGAQGRTRIRMLALEIAISPSPELTSGDWVVETWARECLEIARELRDPAVESVTLMHLGEDAHFHGDNARARDYLEQSLAVAREHDLPSVMQIFVLGRFLYDRGDYRSAQEKLEEAAEIDRGAGVQGGWAA